MRDAGYTQATDVQQHAIGPALNGADLMVSARTGSGKTGAFVMPILERINPLQASCQALILVPTRELAQQVANEAVILTGDTGVNAVAVYGGSSYKVHFDRHMFPLKVHSL